MEILVLPRVSGAGSHNCTSIQTQISFFQIIRPLWFSELFKLGPSSWGNSHSKQTTWQFYHPLRILVRHWMVAGCVIMGERVFHTTMEKKNFWMHHYHTNQHLNKSTFMAKVLLTSKTLQVPFEAQFHSNNSREKVKFCCNSFSISKLQCILKGNRNWIYWIEFIPSH